MSQDLCSAQVEPARLCRLRATLQGLLCGSECGCGYTLFGAGDFAKHEVDNIFFADIADRFRMVEATDNRQPCNAMLKHGSCGDKRRILERDTEWVRQQKISQLALGQTVALVERNDGDASNQLIQVPAV